MTAAEPTSREQRQQHHQRVHQHFCSRCFGAGGKRNSGWYRCLGKHCVKEPQALCPRHQADTP
jgi:hypothetical protein